MKVADCFDALDAYWSDDLLSYHMISPRPLEKMCASFLPSQATRANSGEQRRRGRQQHERAAEYPFDMSQVSSPAAADDRLQRSRAANACMVPERCERGW